MNINGMKGQESGPGRGFDSSARLFRIELKFVSTSSQWFRNIQFTSTSQCRFRATGAPPDLTDKDKCVDLLNDDLKSCTPFQIERQRHVSGFFALRVTKKITSPYTDARRAAKDGHSPRRRLSDMSVANAGLGYGTPRT
ncbi:hypothetical protein VTK73DRAFT_7016 [Phialemonium thermophilum]|uniref:Uncharacterized protein n=1 Tax=Phialemonium thermophilum TaxID=223376 RepID=A0ABR3XUY3_9PEZI